MSAAETWPVEAAGQPFTASYECPRGHTHIETWWTTPTQGLAVSDGPGCPHFAPEDYAAEPWDVIHEASASNIRAGFEDRDAAVSYAASLAGVYDWTKPGGLSAQIAADRAGDRRREQR